MNSIMGRRRSNTAVLLFVFLFVWSGASAAWEALPKEVPVPKDNAMSAEKIELGKQLYFDTRMSGSGKVSCNTCHNVMSSGTDGLQFSKGIGIGDRNSPTVWNSAFWSVQFWDGRAPSLEEQAKGPLINPVEMGMKDHGMVMAAIKKSKGYQESFKKVFGGRNPLTINNVAKAIAAYERTLITPNSAYDKYLAGDKAALSESALRGMNLTKTVGCIACHSGPHFAGPALPMGTGFYQKFPIFPGNDYDKKYGFSTDPGRMKVTKNEADKNKFRVMSWRNVAKTAPYFHNGSVAKLDEAVRVMAKNQLNKDLKDDEVKDIVAFLESLTGEFPLQTAPELPQ